ncbi:MAG: hypothetical protein AAGN35_12780 [Bacteroidota bacterium]
MKRTIIFLTLALFLSACADPPDGKPSTVTEANLISNDSIANSQIPDAQRQTAWGEAAGGLRLGVGIAEEGKVRMVLHTTSPSPIKVPSNISAGEKHYDWYRIHLTAEEGGTQRQYLLLDERNRSAQVNRLLEPGDTLEHQVDFTDWSTRGVHAGEQLPASSYGMSLSFAWDSPNGPSNLRSGQMTVQIGEGNMLAAE